MEDPEAKVCPNCKREIPSVNFTIHNVHCARNIRVCPVCKEPVPHAELQEHHDKLHKLLPCKKCGESVCGTDLEDHIRDSCAHTIKSCRFCELELPRRDLPAHEGYCGVRTEQCPDCREWVMIKYRQLHLDSNHGFLRLDDDPAPIPKKEPLKTTNLSKPLVNKITNLPSTSNGLTRPSTSNGFTRTTLTEGLTRPTTSSGITRPTLNEGLTRPNTSSGLTRPTLTEGLSRPKTSNVLTRPTKLDNASQTNGITKKLNINENNPRTEIRYLGEGLNSAGGSSNVPGSSNIEATSSGCRPPSSVPNGVKVPLKRTNDQPQINTNVADTKKVEKNLTISRGAVKKRQAPKPPVYDAKREQALHSALQRQQREDKERREQTAYNLTVGLPPVLSPLEKLDKLRKMDALQNPPERSEDYKNQLQGRVWRSPEHLGHAGYVLGSSNNVNGRKTEDYDRRNEINERRVEDYERRREEFKNVKPMTPQEFMERFNRIQLRRDEEGANRTEDRFSEIKSSLRELRRGLNEVTAPYNLNSNAIPSGNNRERHRRSPRTSPVPPDEEVRLPCEFCNALVAANDLVLHQTGCRPDLAQLRPSAYSYMGNAMGNEAMGNDDMGDAAMGNVAMGNAAMGNQHEPVIPCEFCTESLPVYLISEHQERCGRESNLLYAD